MELDLADSETPFTDFRMEDDEGLPRAVFDQIETEKSSLLSYLLYPDKVYVGALYLDLMRVSEREVMGMSYEDDFFKLRFTPEIVEVETKQPDEQTGTCTTVKLSVGEAKFLLLKWRFECIRWDVSHYSAEGAARS